MNTKALIAMVALLAGCSGAQTNTDGSTDSSATASTTAATTAPTVTATTQPTTPPTTQPTTPPTTTSSAPTPPPSGSATTGPAPAAGDAKAGEKLFSDAKALGGDKCDSCHGTKAKPGRVGKIFTFKWDDAEKAKAAGFIHKGKGEMPKYDKLSDSQVADLIAYVSSPK